MKGLDEQAAFELIGQGPLWKMVRAALTDPDSEIWRYSITVGGDRIAGDAIRSLLNSDDLDRILMRR